MKRILSASLVALIVFAGCERSVNGLSEPSLSQDPIVYLEGFNGMGSDFYFPFLGARPDVFSVDEEEGFESNSSIRIDVPNANDPSGNFAGAIFRIDGAGRDFSEYDALTFYGKASQGVNIGEIGFGTDFISDAYKVSANSVAFGTNWTKYVIPIPDPSKLVNERGVFWFSTGTQETDGFGYTFWIDNLRFERLGTVGQSRPAILGASDEELTSFIGSTTTIGNLSHTLNFRVEEADARDITLSVAPSYFTFSTSDPSVATVDGLGIVEIVGTGTATITAKLAGDDALGSLEVESLGDLLASPVPQINADLVRSIFSDAYTNATESNFLPNFGGTTVETTFLSTSNGNFVSYANNNFTGIIFDTPIDASEMNVLHVDAYVLDASTSIGVQIRDVGDNQIVDTDVNTGNPIVDDADYRATLNGFDVGVWKSFDIPLAGDIAEQKDNLGAIILTGGPNFILDNIYFYNDGAVALDPPTLPISFDDSDVDYAFGTFGGTTFGVVANPDVSGSNANASSVGSITNSGQNWEGVSVDPAGGVNLSNGSTFTMDVWSNTALPVLLKLEVPDGGAFVEIPQNHTGSGWEELTFTFNSSASFPRIAIFMDGPGNTTGTFYIDNIDQN